MLLPWLVRSEMKIKDLCPLEKTEKTAQSCGFLRFSLLTFCASLYISVIQKFFYFFKSLCNSTSGTMPKTCYINLTITIHKK